MAKWNLDTIEADMAEIRESVSKLEEINRLQAQTIEAMAQASAAEIECLREQLRQAQQRITAAEGERDHQRANKNQAYEERNRLVALLAGLYPSGVKRTDIPGWNPEWHGAVYIDFPWGQASWHYHDSQAHLFAHLPPYVGEWNGHTTEEKYEAITAASLTVQQALRNARDSALEEAAAVADKEADMWKRAHADAMKTGRAEALTYAEARNESAKWVSHVVRSLKSTTQGSRAPSTPTAAEIEAAKTENGGWTKETLASWGVSWPPEKGWRERLIARSGE